MMLERMQDFFDSRLDGYEKHMLDCIESAKEFYPYTASLLPMEPSALILDLGCGTGLELDFYFTMNPTAKIIGIDLAPRMLDELNKKHNDKNIELILGSYFTVPFGHNKFDAAVSVESLHHFTFEEKSGLYKKIYDALKPGGFFILTDYFAYSNDEEVFHRSELLRLKQEQGIDDSEFYHYDTPLTVEHEKQALLAGRFSSVEVLSNWGATYTLRAIK